MQIVQKHINRKKMFTKSHI